MTPTKSIGSLSHASIGNLNGEDEEEEEEEEELPVSMYSTGLTEAACSADSGRVEGLSG